MSTKNYDQWGVMGNQLVGKSKATELDLEREQHARMERQMGEISISLAELIKHISGHMPAIQPQK